MRAAALILASTGVACAAPTGEDQTAASARAFRLAGALSEISGLAPAGPASVFAHDDEHAIIFEIDINTGATLRAFALGKPTLAGDFEGISVGDGLIYLLTSDGRLYEALPADDGARAAYKVYDTGLGAVCEAEGLAAAGGGEFFILCKHSAFGDRGKRLVMCKWTLGGPRSPAQVFGLSLKDLIPNPKGKFRPSDLARDATSGDFLILDSAGASILRISAEGGRVGYRRLAKPLHPQPEGLAIMADGRLVVGDEGPSGQGRLTVYPRSD
jgi:hypothetical protein